MKIFLVIIVLMMASCTSSQYIGGACEKHGGVQMCYRMIGATHGHVMCKDGTTTNTECD